MKFSTAVAAAALAAGVNAWGNSTGPVYVTEVVTAYTTYCPAATEIVHGGKTYTVTKATTLTITNCPCTITKPFVSSAVVTACATCTPKAPASTPVYTPPFVNATTPVYTPPSSTKQPAGTSSIIATAPAFTGAANKAMAASGAGLAAVFGLVAYVL